MRHASIRLTFLSVLSALIAGCSSSGTSPILGLPSASDLGLDALPTTAAIIPAPKKIVGTPTEVYTRVARGVLTCWFGEAGPLKDGYVYHAEAAPASKGSGAKIQIFVRDPKAENQKSLRAYRVNIFEAEAKTNLSIENFRMEEPLASQLNSDVDRWAGEDAGCGASAVVTGWNAEEKPAKQRKKPRRKTAKKKDE